MRVRSVHLVEIDVVGSEARQAGLDGAGDVPGRAAAVVFVWPFGDRETELGRQHHLVAASLQGLADDLFRFAIRIDVRRVDEVDAGV